MKGDTRLDYAEFQLTPKRTRCELFVSADGFREKLATGFVKPFITHLQAAESQVVKGSQVIKLEANPENSLHHHGNDTWFSKGTIERFVRFVSTPEIIERVKTIEDELTQLEQVHSALVNTFVQTSDRFQYGDAATGPQQTRNGIDTLAPKILSTDKDDNEPDASKKELLRAMEARLNTLHQEQEIAFSRAYAAGFDNDNIADLLIFARHFGAVRLDDACFHFLALLCKKAVAVGGPGAVKSPSFETPSDASGSTLQSAYGSMLVTKEDGLLQVARRKLDFAADRSQAANLCDDSAKTESYQNDGMSNTQLAHQTDASSKDFGWPIAGETELKCHSSEKDLDSSVKNKHLHPSFKESKITLPTLTVRTESFPKRRPIPSELGIAQDDNKATNESKDTANIPKDSSNGETERSKGTQGDAPARRLSVQAAISLFESKKKDPNEVPFRKLTKQESRKTLGESVSSPSEKSVLKRWTAPPPCLVESNCAQEAQMLESREPEQDSKEVKVTGEASQVIATPKEVVELPEVRPDQQARENFKKSLNSLLQQDSTKHFEPINKSKSMNGMAQDTKQSPLPISDLRKSTDEINIRLDSKNLPSLAKKILTTKLGTEKVEVETATASMLAKTALLKKVNCDSKLALEVESEAQPLPSRKSIDNKAHPEQEREEKEVVKTRNAKETLLLPKASNIVPPQKLRNSSQVLARAAFEPENMATLEADSHVDEASVKEIEKVRLKETLPANEKQTSRNASFGRPSVQKRTSTVKELSANVLTASVDLHMQALVQMVEHQYTNSSFNAVDLVNDQQGEQRGRFYDQYAKLRDAKIRGEHPAKKAEREAKLKSMQETLERRRAEMQAKVVRLSKKNLWKARDTELGSDQTPCNVGISASLVEQKDLKAEDGDTDQEDYSSKSQEQHADYSSPTSPATTPRSLKGRSSSLKLRASKTLPTLQNSISSQRSLTRGGGSSPKPSPKNPGGTPGQGKPPSLTSSTSETGAVKSVPNVRDVARTSVTRPGGSSRIHPRLNVSANEATVLMDEQSIIASPGNVERQEVKHQPTSTKKNAIMSRSLNMEAGIQLAYPKDQQEGVSDAMDSFQQKTNPAQEGRPFLRKGRGIGAGAGPGIMKEKASFSVESSKSLYEENKQDEGYKDHKIIQVAPENSSQDFGTNCEEPVRDQDTFLSGVQTVATVNEDSRSACSESSTELTESIEVEASDKIAGNVLENETEVPDLITSHEKSGTSEPVVVQAGSNGSLFPLPNQKRKEGSVMLSDHLSEQTSEPVGKSISYVASSVSFREASRIPQGQGGSPFPASLSNSYTSMLQRGALSSRFSPPKEDLPSSNSALWNLSQSSKLGQDGELAHSGRRLAVNPKLPSMLPLPAKESSKGFKRLLHFGRKSRTSESTADCVSVSTTSEGDDDGDEARECGTQLPDELLQKLRMQKKGFDYGNMGDQLSYSDQETSQFLGTAIPPPPANFKLREELLSGGNLIKAPRSFFSLSSFRSSKGGEGKSR